MTKNNDERILELKAQIDIKKKDLGKTLRFSPITNCLVNLDGVNYNLNVLNKDDLQLLLVKLNLYRISTLDLISNELLESELVINGYTISDWLEDVQSKLSVLNRKDEESKLKAMESKLTKLLSERKKVELEIDEIESLLK